MNRTRRFDPTKWECNVMHYFFFCKRQKSSRWNGYRFLRRTLPNASFLFFLSGFLATFLFSFSMISFPGMMDYSMNLCTNIPSSDVIETNNTRFQSFPRVVRYIEPHQQNTNHIPTIYSNNSLRLDPNTDKYPSKRLIEPIGNFKLQNAIEYDDDYYGNQLLNSDITEECQLRYGWQKISNIPTCNQIHEFDLSSFSWEMTRKTKNNRQHRKNRYAMIAEGFWSSVFVASQYDSIVSNKSRMGDKNLLFVLKAMRYRHEFTPRNLNRMSREALIMERLTSSPFVINIYSFCGTSSFSEYGDGKDITAAIWPTDRLEHEETEPARVLQQLDKLHIATQAAIGLADLHNVDSEGEASIAHTDISPNQYVKVKDVYKLNDFNRARFIPWSHQHNASCTYRIGSNPGKNRAPEEYKLEPQSEKIDVYSLGNIFYMLLQGEYPFDDIETDEAQKLVMQGNRPTFYIDVWNSTDPIDQALKAIMIRCHEQDPDLRPTAREVAHYLKRFLREIDPGRLEQWGVN